MVTLLMGLVAVSLIVVAYQLSCFFAYEESKKGGEVSETAGTCWVEQ